MKLTGGWHRFTFYHLSLEAEGFVLKSDDWVHEPFRWYIPESHKIVCRYGWWPAYSANMVNPHDTSQGVYVGQFNPW